MAYARRNDRRDANEPEIIAAFESFECKVIPQARGAGFDLLVLIPHVDESLIVEVKTEENSARLTKAEHELQIWCILHGKHYEIIIHPIQVSMLLKELA